MKTHSVVRLSLTGSRTVTVYRSETDLKKEYDNNDLHGRIIMLSNSPMKDMAKALLDMKGVSAVEVVQAGNGIRLEK